MSGPVYSAGTGGGKYSRGWRFVLGLFCLLIAGFAAFGALVALAEGKLGAVVGILTLGAGFCAVGIVWVKGKAFVDPGRRDGGAILGTHVEKTQTSSALPGSWIPDPTGDVQDIGDADCSDGSDGGGGGDSIS